MTDEAGNTHPDPDDAVRRLLADARHYRADARRRGGPDGRRARRPGGRQRRRRRDSWLRHRPGTDPPGRRLPRGRAPPSRGRDARRRRGDRRGWRRRRPAPAQPRRQPVRSLGGRGPACPSTAGSVAGGSSKSAGAEALSGNAFDRARATVRNGRVVVHPQHFTSDAFAARRLLGQMRHGVAGPRPDRCRPVLRRRAGTGEARERDVRASSGGAGVPPAGEHDPGRRPVRLRVPPTGAVGHPPPPLTPSGAATCRRESRSPTICSSQWSRSLAGGPTEPPTGTQEQSMSQSPLNDQVRNVIIIGSGPAGYTAAVYAARASLQPARLRGLGDRRRRPDEHHRGGELPRLP